MGPIALRDSCACATHAHPSVSPQPARPAPLSPASESGREESESRRSMRTVGSGVPPSTIGETARGAVGRAVQAHTPSAGAVSASMPASAPAVSSIRLDADSARSGFGLSAAPECFAAFFAAFICFFDDEAEPPGPLATGIFLFLPNAAVRQGEAGPIKGDAGDFVRLRLPVHCNGCRVKRKALCRLHPNPPPAALRPSCRAHLRTPPRPRRVRCAGITEPVADWSYAALLVFAPSSSLSRPHLAPGPKQASGPTAMRTGIGIVASITFELVLIASFCATNFAPMPSLHGKTGLNGHAGSAGTAGPRSTRLEVFGRLVCHLWLSRLRFAPREPTGDDIRAVSRDDDLGDGFWHPASLPGGQPQCPHLPRTPRNLTASPLCPPSVAAAIDALSDLDSATR
jgi:hypothetical protein